MNDSSVGVRVQKLEFQEQALVLGRLAQARTENGDFTTAELTELFSDISLPGPANASSTLSALEKKGLVRKSTSRQGWQLTPLGRHHSDDLLSDFDLAALSAQAAVSPGPELGQTMHTLIAPALAPPKLLLSLKKFLADH